MLYLVFLPSINNALRGLLEDWNNNPLSSEHNFSPYQIWRLDLSCYQISNLDLLDETHLDAVRGLMSQRGFTSAHQQVELVGAMRLRPTRTNRSAYCLYQGFYSKLKNLD